MEYELQFLVRVAVDAEDIRTATNSTYIHVTAETNGEQNRNIEVHWEATKRWDDDGDVVEQYREDD